MTLQELLDKARGSYELTIFRDEINRVCEDEEIPDIDPDMDGCVDFRDYIPGWNAVKDCRVKDFRLTTDRNCNGAAIWITIDC